MGQKTYYKAHTGHIKPESQNWHMGHVYQVRNIQKDNRATPNKSMKGSIMQMSPKVNDCVAV